MNGLGLIWTGEGALVHEARYLELRSLALALVHMSAAVGRYTVVKRDGKRAVLVEERRA